MNGGELWIRFSIGLPILYALTGGLVLRTAIRWFNRIHFPRHAPLENAKPPENPWSDESPAVPDLPAPPNARHDGLLQDPSLPKAIGIQVLSFLIHALIIAIVACPLPLADKFELPRSPRNVILLVTVLLAVMSLPAHYLLEAWLLRRTIPTTFLRACELTLIGWLIWFLAGVMLLTVVGIVIILVAVIDS